MNFDLGCYSAIANGYKGVTERGWGNTWKKLDNHVHEI